MGIPCESGFLASVADVKIQNDITGRLLTASVELCGILSCSEADFENGEEEFHYHCVGKQHLEMQTFPDYLEVELGKRREAPYYLPIQTFKVSHWARGDITRVVGLIVEKVPDRESLVYRRIGCFATDSLEDMENLCLKISGNGLAVPKVPIRTQKILVI